MTFAAGVHPLDFRPFALYSRTVFAEIAHLAERRTRNAQVSGSIPDLGFTE